MKARRVKSPNAAPAYQLTKTKYCTGLQCLKALYLSVHDRDLATPPDKSAQRIFEIGHKVGAMARQQFPEGIMIDADHFHHEEALLATQSAIESDAKSIFEAAFLFEGVLIRVDILCKNSEGSWDIVEVKSSTKVKAEHLPDMAIQRYVLAKQGIKVGKSILKHINNQCVHPNLENLFTDVDCTPDVLGLIRELPNRLKEMVEVLESSQAPLTDIGPHCEEPYECSFKEHCWKHIPKYSVFELSGVWSSTKHDLFKAGVTRIADIPDNKKVSRSKPEQIEAVKKNSPVINKSGVREFIKKLQYPLFFLDFETINPAIPVHNGMRPYEQFPDQFSCHIEVSPNSDLVHREFLGTPPEDPRKQVAELLVNMLGKKGTVIAYNAVFETTRITELAETFPSLRNELLSITERFVDLLDVFKKFYFHPDFHGSNSIKSVLPVLVPSMSYADLRVVNGNDSQTVYEALYDRAILPAERENMRNDLLEYCKRDSFAMVEILRVLRRV